MPPPLRVRDRFSRPICCPWPGTNAPAGGWQQSHLFAGEYWDQDAQLLYLRARWYDPRIGRFISGDPFEGKQRDPRSLNRYSYAMSDPVHRSDPSGMFAPSENFVATSGMLTIGGATATAGASLARIAATRVTQVLLVAGAAVLPTVINDGCFRSGQRDCDSGQTPPVIVWGGDYLAHTQHVKEAIMNSTSVLHYTGPGDREWIRRLEPCRSNYGTNSGLQCDEYPYASTREGGEQNKEWVSLRLIPASANLGAGGKLSRFIDRCRIMPTGGLGSEYVVRAEPTLPQTLTYCRGRMN